MVYLAKKSFFNYNQQFCSEQGLGSRAERRCSVTLITKKSGMNTEKNIVILYTHVSLLLPHSTLQPILNNIGCYRKRPGRNARGWVIPLSVASIKRIT